MDKEAILKEVIMFDNAAPIRDDEFTWEEYREELIKALGRNIGRKATSERLNNLVFKGILVKREATVQGRRRIVYKLIRKPKEKKADGYS